MAWRDRFKQGTFRGVLFHLESSDDTRAKRIITHEYPGRDKAFLEEMGKRPIPFKIDAFVVGQDCLEQRDALQIACDKPGAGILVHPFYGELLVKCEEIVTRHDKSEMGVVRFSMSFVQEGFKNPIESVVNTQVKTFLTAKDVIEKQKTTFDKLFQYASIPYAKAQSVQAMVNKSVDDINKARALVGQVAKFAEAVRNIGGSLTSLLLDSEQLFKEIANVITFGFLTEDTDSNTVPDTLQSFTQMSSLFAYTPLVASASDTSTAYIQIVQGISIAQGAHLLSIAQFDSVDSATEFRDILFNAIDSYLASANLDDDLYLSVQELRTNVEEDIAVRSNILPRLVTITLPEFMPALVLSYKLYASLTFENDILTRNRIANPGIVPSDVPLKVLTDG